MSVLFVGQDPMMLPGSLWDNLTFGVTRVDGADPARVEQILPLWALMDAYGLLWMLMGPYGPLLALMGHHGHLLSLMGAYGVL